MQGMRRLHRLWAELGLVEAQVALGGGGSVEERRKPTCRGHQHGMYVWYLLVRGMYL